MSDAVVQTPVKQSDSSRNIFIACCAVVLLVLCICCSGFIFLLAGGTFKALTAYNEVEKSVKNFCSATESNLSDFYSRNTSNAFKDATSLSEFQSFYKKYKNTLINCSNLNNGVFSSLLSGGSISYETTNGKDVFGITYKSGDYTVIIELVTEGSEWKVNSINIK